MRATTKRTALLGAALLLMFAPAARADIVGPSLDDVERVTCPAGSVPGDEPGACIAGATCVADDDCEGPTARCLSADCLCITTARGQARVLSQCIDGVCPFGDPQVARRCESMSEVERVLLSALAGAPRTNDGVVVAEPGEIAPAQPGEIAPAEPAMRGELRAPDAPAPTPMADPNALPPERSTEPQSRPPAASSGGCALSCAAAPAPARGWLTAVVLCGLLLRRRVRGARS